MTARKNLLLMAVLLLAAVGVHSAAVATAGRGGEVVRGEGYVVDHPTVGGGGGSGFAVCRVGCPDALWNCNAWCHKNGYNNGGLCVPPLRQQCCCYGA